MKPLIHYFKIFLILSFFGYFSQCVVPLNTSFESAKMLDKGEVEFMGSYAHYSFASDGENEATNNNVSARIGIGISKLISAKLPESVKLHSLKLYETQNSYAEWFASDQ